MKGNRKDEYDIYILTIALFMAIGSIAYALIVGC